MKKIPSFLLVILIISCNNHLNTGKLDDDFFTDFASENSRISGALYLDHFDEDLSTLDFDTYFEFLEKDVKSSAVEIVPVIKNADQKLLVGYEDFFIVLLYFKEEGLIIGDNSNTAEKIDLNEPAPKENGDVQLSSFLKYMINSK